MIHRAATHALLWAILCASAAAQTITADQCRQQYARDPAAQVTCARQAYAVPAAAAPPAPAAPAPPASETPAAPLLIAPLANVQIIFGFFDRRFPGFNNGQEHLGVDFAATPGAAVAAICDGTVVLNNTSQIPVVAAVLIIEHDCPQPLGLVYGYYGHVQSELWTGDPVIAGSSIGTIRDWAGNSHLHLGLNTRLQEENWGLLPRGATLQEIDAQGWLNPLNYFAGFPIRQSAGNAPQPAAKRPPVNYAAPAKPAGKPAAGNGRLPRAR